MDTIISANEDILYIVKNISLEEDGSVKQDKLYLLLDKMQRENKND
ncbi:hypothetical protein ACQPV1_18500 [Clostridium neonatale]